MNGSDFLELMKKIDPEISDDLTEVAPKLEENGIDYVIDHEGFSIYIGNTLDSMDVDETRGQFECKTKNRLSDYFGDLTDTHCGWMFDTLYS
jgi:hypothetical protein